MKDMKTLVVDIDSKLHRRVKVESAALNVSMRDIVTIALSEYFLKRDDLNGIPKDEH